MGYGIFSLCAKILSLAFGQGILFSFNEQLITQVKVKKKKFKANLALRASLSIYHLIFNMCS